MADVPGLAATRSLTVIQQGAVPDTYPGELTIYADASGNLHAKNGSGTDIILGTGGGSGITQLTGDVTAGPGSGSVAATVVSVGGATAANVASATGKVLAASTSGYVLTATGVAGAASFQPAASGGTSHSSVYGGGLQGTSASPQFGKNSPTDNSTTTGVDNIAWVAPYAGTVTAVSGYASGSGGTYTLTVYKNGTAQSLVTTATTMTAGNTGTPSYATGSVSFVAGDVIQVSFAFTSALSWAIAHFHVIY